MLIELNLRILALIATLIETTTAVGTLCTSKLSVNANNLLWDEVLCFLLNRIPAGQADPWGRGSAQVLCRLSQGIRAPQSKLQGKGRRGCEAACDLPIWLGRNSRALRGKPLHDPARPAPRTCSAALPAQRDDMKRFSAAPTLRRIPL